MALEILRATARRWPVLLAAVSGRFFNYSSASRRSSRQCRLPFLRYSGFPDGFIHSGVNKKASIVCLGIQGGPDGQYAGYKNM